MGPSVRGNPAGHPFLFFNLRRKVLQWMEMILFNSLFSTSDKKIIIFIFKFLIIGRSKKWKEKVLVLKTDLDYSFGGILLTKLAFLLDMLCTHTSCLLMDKFHKNSFHLGLFVCNQTMNFLNSVSYKNLWAFHKVTKSLFWISVFNYNKKCKNGMLKDPPIHISEKLREDKN